MKIGLLGGTFDPVHIGHLNCANQAACRFGLDTVFFIPTAVPPHKRKGGAPIADRLAMVKSAIRSNPLFKISRLEIAPDRPSYTIDTVRRFHKKGGELYYIMGVDAFSDIYSWRSSGELFSLCNFIVVSRPGTDLRNAATRLVREFRADGIKLRLEGGQAKNAVEVVMRVVGSQFTVYLCRFTELDVSSTQIRRMGVAGESIKYLVPEAVEQYITRRGLYLK